LRSYWYASSVDAIGNWPVVCVGSPFDVMTRVAPFNDRRVRRALNYAIDRRAVVRATGGSTAATPTCQILPPNFPGYVHYCPYRAPELRTARRLVTASGTRGMRVTVWTNEALKRPAIPVVALLRRLGYHAALKVIPTRARVGYFEQISDSRTRAQAGTFLWAGDYPAPSTFLRLLSCGTFLAASPNNLNWSEYCNPAIDAQMHAAARTQAINPQRANRDWTRIDRALVHAAPWLPLLNPRSIELLSQRVGGYRYNPVYGTLIDQLWIR
jgi:peptide/nickel transport system substrate-binding protein